MWNTAFYHPVKCGLRVVRIIRGQSDKADMGVEYCYTNLEQDCVATGTKDQLIQFEPKHYVTIVKFKDT